MILRRAPHELRDMRARVHIGMSSERGEPITSEAGLTYFAICGAQLRVGLWRVEAGSFTNCKRCEQHLARCSSCARVLELERARRSAGLTEVLT